LLRACAAARSSGTAAVPDVGASYAAALPDPAAYDALAYPTGCDLYFAALGCAVCGAAAARDTAIGAGERGKRSGIVAPRAVVTLKRPQPRGFCRLPGTAKALKSDRAFEPLRSRPDFQALLK